jgi:hypothetical protein
MQGEAPLLLETGKGLTVRCGGIYLYPLTDPIDYARRKAFGAELAPRTLVFVPSVGLGYGLSELLDKLPEESAVLCVEADQGIMALASALRLPQDPRLTIIRTENEEAVSSVLSRIGTGRFRRVVEVPLSAGYRLAPEYYQRLYALLGFQIRLHWQNRLTLMAMGSLWVRNLFDNLPLLAESNDLGIVKSGMPVVVAGAGPSLDASIPFLRRLRKRFFLMAVDTALPALASQSLVPDIVVTLEAQVMNLKDFLSFHDSSVFLACELSSFPPVLRLFRGNLFFFSSSFAPLSLFERLKASHLHPLSFPALGSVGVAAAHAALRITEGDVMLTGLDFAYPRGRTHARGTPAHLAMLLSHDRLHGMGQGAYTAIMGRPLIRERDKRGTKIATDIVLKSYRDGLSRRIEEDARRIWDLGEEGLPLGAHAISAEEAAARLSSSPEGECRLEELRCGNARNAQLGAFLDGERKLLKEAGAALSSALAAGERAPLSNSVREILHAVDHVYLHFPEVVDLESPGRSFLARALVAVGYYAERLGRTPR